MGKKQIIFIFLMVLVHLSSWGQNKALDNDFVAPLNIPLYLSGNFAELRSNHFHTGIDIKTQGKIGQDIYCIEDGYLSRVYVSPYGYGRALYVTHPNGYTSVYGHLDSFSEKIDQKVKTLQYQNEQYTLDHQFGINEIQLKKGEIIAKSGNSGSSGGPHLHFEIRKTVSEKPINPLLFGFDIKDEMRPQLNGIKLFSINGMLNGADQNKYYPTVFYANKFHLKANPSIKAWGEIGIGIQSFDYLSGDWSKCGIREAELFVDGQSYAIYQADTLDFSELRYINASIDYKEKLSTGKWILQLFKDKPNNHLSNIRPFINRGILRIDEERPYNVKIVVRDTYNNQSTLSFSIKGHPYALKKQGPNLEAHPFFWNQENILAKNNFRIHIPAKLLYANTSFTFKESKSSFFLSDIYTIGDVYTPLHAYASVRIKPNKTIRDTTKYYMLRVSSKGRKIEALTSSYKNGWVEAGTRHLGSFTLLEDTIPPKIRALQTITNKNLQHLKNIRFKISDGESGIKRYKAYIDKQWVLFEYDGKNALISYTFDPHRLTRNQNHELRLELTDNCNNTNIYTTRFYW